ncbi:MAG: insulinase family protein [Rhodobacteraceae bacterium]|nr:insulinase family protein [Paracoccaceae bacterium]
MLHRALMLVAVMVCAAPVLAAETASEQVTTFTLDNGMEAVVIEDHRAPAVVHMVWYRAGSADEPAGVSGIAHFLEHLMFKGTDTIAPGEFSQIVAANGGTDNAFTSFDYTGYFQRVAADRLELMMQMEADRMVNLTLTQDEVRTEREVILEERNQRVENDPGALFNEQRRAALYMNHRYGVPIIGWRHEIESLDLQDALDFYADNYAPNNAILVVAGDVDPADVKRLAQTYYGPIPADPTIVPRQRPQEPPQLSERRMVMNDPRVAQPYIIRTYLAPERDPGAQEKAAALVMLAEVLGGGQTSVLNRKLQFETQTVVYTSAFYSGTSLDDTGFGLVAVPADGVSLQEAEEALDKAVAEFITEGVDAAQLDRIKFQMRAQQIYARDNVDRLARRYGGALASGLTVADVQAWPDILQAVTEADIIAAAKEIFDRKKSVTGWLMGAEQEGTL